MQNILEKIIEFQSFFPIDKELKKSIKDFLDVKYNYNSNAIEWTTLSEAETALVLKWETIPKHSLIEHFEIINHKKAFDFVWDLTSWIENSKKNWLEIFSEENILKIHSFLLNNINDDNAGIYRRHNVKIAFSRAILPRWEKVSDLMTNFFEKYKNNFEILSTKKNNSLEKLQENLKYWYDLHLDFVKIHPFIDWNWRTARLLQNMFFLNEINNINIIYFKNRKDYIDSIDLAWENIKIYYDFMNSNFSEFKEEELEILRERIIYKY